MTPEEAKSRLAAENERLRTLEAEIARLASTHATSVLLGMLQALVERVCAVQGPYFVVLNKTKFYEGVLRTLHGQGIS